MQEKHLYEYAVLRYVPRVEREEFVNVGLVMMCKRRQWLKIEVKIPLQRINAFDGELSINEIATQLNAFVGIGNGNVEAGLIASYPVEERFRWITAVKSCCFQTSRPHPGYCDDLDDTFSRIFKELVE